MGKPLRRRIVDRPSVLVCHEKHTTPLWYIDSDAELFAVSLVILQNRLDEGWIVEPDGMPKSPGMTLAQVEALPEGPIKDNARNTLVAYTNQLREHERDASEWTEIHRCLKEKDGRAAWRILQGRCDAEYERVELETLNQVPARLVRAQEKR